jgi:hypothetical protein
MGDEILVVTIIIVVIILVTIADCIFNPPEG